MFQVVLSVMRLGELALQILQGEEIPRVEFHGEVAAQWILNENERSEVRI
jgi:hypothetical protein